jgi:hypothetical protein
MQIIHELSLLHGCRLDAIGHHEQCVLDLRLGRLCMARFVLLDSADDDDAEAVSAAAGEPARALRLSRPVSAEHGPQHERGTHELRCQHAAPHAAEVEPRGPERERQRDGHSDAVERGDVNPRRLLRPRAAPKYAAAGRLRAVAELSQAEQRQSGGGEVEDGGVGGEHPRPDAAHRHGEGARHEAQRCSEAEPDARDEARAVGAPGPELVADARGHGTAERVREDVYQRGRLDEHAHGRHGSLGVDEHAAEEHHDLVPPPLQAHRHAAVHAQPHQSPPLLGALLIGRHIGRVLLGAVVVVHSGEVHVRQKEDQEVDVGQDPAERDAADAEAEDIHKEEVDGHVEEQRGGGAVGERQRDGLRAEVDADRVEEALHGQVREAPQDVRVRRGADVRVLAGGHENPMHGHPEHADGQGRDQEHNDGAPESGAEEVRAPRAECLPADRVHPAGEAGQHGVAGDVTEAQREGAASERELAEPAQEHHRHQGAQVEQDPRADHRPGEAEDGGHLA